MQAWTDEPIFEEGDLRFHKAPIRACKVLNHNAQAGKLFVELESGTRTWVDRRYVYDVRPDETSGNSRREMMGEAKRRGTKEERVAQAKSRTRKQTLAHAVQNLNVPLAASKVRNGPIPAGTTKPPRKTLWGRVKSLFKRKEEARV